MKKIHKVLTALLISIFCCGSVFAASLDQVCNQLSQHPITKGDFVQIKSVNTAKGKRDLKSSGTFIFGVDGIMWKTVKPFPSSMVVTRTAIIQTAADGKQNIIDGKDNATFASIASTVSAVFSNDLTLLKENFNISFKDNGNNTWEMDLEPKDKTISSVMKSLKIGGSTTNNSSSLDSIIMYEASDNQITYKFTNQTYPKELTADEKAFFAAR